MPETDLAANPDPPNSRLLVGCGYLGRRIAARWLAGGHHVFATTRGRAAELQSLGVTPIIADVLNPTSLQSLPACATVVFGVGFDRGGPHSMHDVYVHGLQNLIHNLPRPAKFIYISSTGVYGDARGAWVGEAAAPNPADESGRIVLEAEELLRRNLPQAIILRFAGIYGPGRLLRRIDGLRRGEPIAADPDKWLNLIHVEDGADAVIAAENRAASGEIFNVCDDLPVRRGEFFAKLAELVGAPQPSFFEDSGSRERGNRRISNPKMHERLGVTLKYPSFREGLAQSVPASGLN